ncbi:MAG: chlorophyll synthesis pathway protein BchC, partial [Pseudomonadota bacterium]
NEPGRLSLDQVELVEPGADDLVVDVDWSGISTGTEKLLWTGNMPAFPGLEYPLVPGYETVGRVVEAPAHHRARIGERVYVPGSAGYKTVRGLFGGSASRIIVPAAKARRIAPELGKNAILLALAATAYHALAAPHAKLPQLIVGHGVLGRLLARLTLALGAEAPRVWEVDAVRRSGAQGYSVLDPASDTGRTYQTIYDVSGAAGIVDQLVVHLHSGGEIVLAGFYSGRVDFAFPPAFMKEARIRVAAEWQPQDMKAVQRLIEDGRLDLSGLITHERDSSDAAQAYDQAFNDPNCLKMVLNWSGAE